MVELTTSEAQGVLVIAARGDLNAHTSAKAEADLMRLIEGSAQRVVLDLAEVRYVSSAGLRVFLLAARKVGPKGAFVLARPTPDVRGILNLAGFSRILKLADDLGGAVAMARAG